MVVVVREAVLVCEEWKVASVNGTVDFGGVGVDAVLVGSVDEGVPCFWYASELRGGRQRDEVDDLENDLGRQSD